MTGKLGAMLLFLVGSWHASAGTLPFIVLNPSSGHITGAPGDTMGWGFTITGDSSYWISFTDSTLTQSAPTVGSYTDFLGLAGGPTGGVLDPGGTWSQAFDSILMTGLGSYAIDGGAPDGSQDTGTIIIHYLAFNADPTDSVACPVDCQVGGTNQLFLSDFSTVPSFALDVQAPSSVPEPAATVPLCLILAGWAGAALRRRFAR